MADNWDHSYMNRGSIEPQPEPHSWPTTGSTVKFVLGGYPGEFVRASKYFTAGEHYEVADFQLGGQTSYVRIKGYEDKGQFNTAMFKKIKAPAS